MGIGGGVGANGVQGLAGMKCRSDVAQTSSKKSRNIRNIAKVYNGKDWTLSWIMGTDFLSISKISDKDTLPKCDALYFHLIFS